MFDAAPSTLLPQYSDGRGRGRASVRSILSSKRARILVALALTFTVALFLAASSQPLQSRIYGSSNQINLEDNLPERTRPPPAPESTYTLLPTSANTPTTTNDDSSDIWRLRANRVKEAFVRGYTAYYKNAFPHDELRPMTPETNNYKDK